METTKFSRFLYFTENFQTANLQSKVMICYKIDKNLKNVTQKQGLQDNCFRISRKVVVQIKT